MLATMLTLRRTGTTLMMYVMLPRMHFEPHYISIINYLRAAIARL